MKFAFHFSKYLLYGILDSQKMQYICNDVFLAKLSRQHNDSNILVLGARVIGVILALEILKTWLETPFEGGRHQDRINMMDILD